MRFKCEIDNIRTLKKGMKLTLSLDDEQTREIMKHIYNFMDKPITIDLLIDEQEQRERLKQITSEQRKKIYAILRDMENYIGDSVESLKEKTKSSFIKATEYEDFSLSNCSKELAADYIEFLITLCFEMGVPLRDRPIDAFEDVDRYLYLCLNKKVCAVCGAQGEVHHCTGSRIGMGRNRDKISNKGEKVISLCRTHHNEIHTMPEEEFFEKYHVYGVIWDE